MDSIPQSFLGKNWTQELLANRRFDIMLLMAAAVFPLYKTGVLAFPILPLFSLISILQFYKQRTRLSKSEFQIRLKYFVVTTAFYGLMVISLLYSADLREGWRTVQHGVYLLIYPLIIILFCREITVRHFNQIMISFVLACTVYMIYIQFYFYAAGLYTNFRAAEFNDLPFRDVVMTLKYGQGHPTYVSMWFLFCCLFLIHALAKEKLSKVMIICFVLLIQAFVVTSVLLSAKITIIAFFFSLLVLVYQLIKNKVAVFITYFVLATIFILAVFKVSFLRARFIDEYQITALEPPVGLATNSLNIRVGILICTRTVFENNWLVGTGVGDSQNELNKCYNNFDTNVYKESQYNTHNQFFETAISTGIVGLCVFVFMFAFHIRKSLQFDNTLFLVFLIFFMICMLTENILSRYNGIVFYAIFNSLFVKLNLNGQKE